MKMISEQDFFRLFKTAFSSAIFYLIIAIKFFFSAQLLVQTTFPVPFIPSEYRESMILVFFCISILALTAGTLLISIRLFTAPKLQPMIPPP